MTRSLTILVGLMLLATACGVNGLNTTAGMTTQNTLPMTSPAANLTPGSKGGTLNLTPGSKGGTLDLTPGSKGGTLDITPHTKGTTLLEGVVVWPSEARKLSDARFDIRLLSERESQTVTTDWQGHFQLADVQLARDVILEARSVQDSEVVLKLRFNLPEAPVANKLRVRMTMDSTALAALYEDASNHASPLMDVPLELFEQPEMMSEVMPVKIAMLELLKSDLTLPLERQPSVQTALTTARQRLESLQREHPELMEP